MIENGKVTPTTMNLATIASRRSCLCEYWRSTACCAQPDASLAMAHTEKDKRKLYFSSRGFKAQEIEIAPDLLEEVPSKRAPLIKEEVLTERLFQLLISPHFSRQRCT